MTVVKSTEEFLKEHAARFGPPQEFQPAATHIRSGDCIEVFIRPGAYYAERLDDRLTVYYRRGTKGKSSEIVGFLIKGVQALLQTFPGFGIEIRRGKVPLKYLLRIHVWTAPPSNNVAYRNLIDETEKADAEADLVGV